VSAAAEAVSIPYRLATNEFTESQYKFLFSVSIPYRLATNQTTMNYEQGKLMFQSLIG